MRLVSSKRFKTPLGDLSSLGEWKLREWRKAFYNVCGNLGGNFLRRQIIVHLFSSWCIIKQFISTILVKNLLYTRRHFGARGLCTAAKNFLSKTSSYKGKQADREAMASVRYIVQCFIIYKWSASTQVSINENEKLRRWKKTLWRGKNIRYKINCAGRKMNWRLQMIKYLLRQVCKIKLIEPTLALQIDVCFRDLASNEVHRRRCSHRVDPGQDSLMSPRWQ